MRVLSLLSLAGLLACHPDDKNKGGAALDTGGLSADEDEDGYVGAEDCDDADASAHPGAVEICDGVDNNCDGVVDDGVQSVFYADVDADGFGDAAVAVEACDAPSGYVSVPSDCDDRDANTWPGAAERCDSIDNDCDGDIDEDVLFSWYADADRDGYGSPDDPYTACDPPGSYVANADDCNDLDATAWPGSPEVCDEVDNNCDGTVDEDVTTTYYRDEDEDSYGLADVTTEACGEPDGYALRPGDCDDTNDDISPNGVEVCDGADNDCDGIGDEADAVDAAVWYADADSDRYADASSFVSACVPPSGYISVKLGDELDCDDSDASIHPRAAERCDGVDEDCNTIVDDGATDASTFYADGDGDGYGGSISVDACGPPGGFVSVGGDCNDAEVTIYPGASETCDDEDNDCDGDIDEDVSSSDAPIWYIDRDGDGYGSTATTARACAEPSGYVGDSTDCDDSRADVYPGGTEVCDGADNNCDGSEDEGTLGTGLACPAESCAGIIADQPRAADGTYYLDWDGDGYPSRYTCDMTSDGGGWTQVVTWNAEDDGDGWAELDDELDTVYDNMTLQSSAATYIYWADEDSTADLLAYERVVTMPNSGEIRLDLHYAGYSMDNSAAFFYAETTSADENILCKQDDDGGYSTTEYSYWPYTCADSADGSWDWDGVWQDAYTDEITAFHLRSFHYDGSGGDYSYLYRLNVYIR